MGFEEAFHRVRRLSRRNLTGLPIALAVVLASAAALYPELSMGLGDQNDNVFHFALITGIADALKTGQNPMDSWNWEWSFGFPFVRDYPVLAHGLVVLSWLCLGKSVGLMTVFVWFRYLSLVLLPLSFFACARLMRLPGIAAAAAAVLAPLISTNGLQGLDYGSYVWSGRGLFAQAVAVHLLLWTLGCAFRSVFRKAPLTLPGALLGLTFLCHFIYGYIGALSVVLMLAVPDPRTRFVVRVRRVAGIVGVALILGAFQILTLLQDRGILSRLHNEDRWKWDSYGARQVLQWLFAGELLDWGRVPVLSLLALCGALALFWRLVRLRRIGAPRAFVLAGAVLWILVFFGRPFWGSALTLLGIAWEMQLHRVIGGVQLFLVLLAACGIAAFWDVLARRVHWIAAAAAVLGLLYPMAAERVRYLGRTSSEGEEFLAAFENSRTSGEAIGFHQRVRLGRVYSRGAFSKADGAPIDVYLAAAHVPVIPQTYYPRGLTAEILPLFDEYKAEHYRLFNILTVVEAGRSMAPPAAVLSPPTTVGRFRVFDAPFNDYLELVRVPAVVAATQENFLAVNTRWLASDWLARKSYLWLDWSGAAPASLARWAPGSELPPPPAAPPPAGTFIRIKRGDNGYEAVFRAAESCFVLCKASWHPNWHVSLDGAEQEPVMLSPGFLGVPVSPGRHRLLIRYAPGIWRPVMASCGLLIVLLIGRSRRRQAIIET